MSEIITFGEIMLRLAPKGYLRFMQEPELQATYGGGEANVAVSLANFGLDVSFVTKLPENEIGIGAINQLRSFGVDTSKIRMGGKRIGIYYLEKGASQRPSKVIYDRAFSSISEATKEDFDWEKIFQGTKWFHFTGITPALGDNVSQICLDAVKVAKDMNITVSCDLNYRKNLWTQEKASQQMKKIMPYVDVCIANEEDAEKVFGIKAENTNVEMGKINNDSYKYVAETLAEQFSCSHVAITLRESISASDNIWSAMIYNNRDFYFSRKYDVRIVDRVGGGDSFGGGLIYGLYRGMNIEDSLDFAVAASCLKHSIEGDFNRVSVSEVQNLVDGDGTGRVKR